MKLKLISRLLGCLFVAPAFAQQPQPAYMLQGAARAVVTDVAVVKDQFWMAAGERGHILKSLDGQQWQQMPVPLQSNLNSIFFVDEQHGWAVGHDASIIHTQDGGASWQIQQFLPELDKPLFDIYFSDVKHGFAIGAYGMFFRTSDGGKTWQKEFHLALASQEDQEFLAELQETDPEAFAAETESVLPHFNRLYAHENTIYMVGEAGFFAKSTDGGQSWQRQPEFYNGSLFGIVKTQAQSLIVVGLRGHVFRSTDDGHHWQQIDVSLPSTLNSVMQDNSGSIYLLGNAGALLLSEDDGQHFQAIPQPDGKAIMHAFAQKDQLVLATEAGIKMIPQQEIKQP